MHNFTWLVNVQIASVFDTLGTFYPTEYLIRDLHFAVVQFDIYNRFRLYATLRPV